MNRAIFLDRDGTINKEIHYLHEPDKFEFISNVPGALRKLQQSGYQLIVITNQGAIGKGYYDHKDVSLTHARMVELLSKHGIHLNAIYYCPHKDSDKCPNRKPNPGMILRAIKRHSIDVNHSWMIGDKISDIIAGNLARLRTILVRTGYGAEHFKQLIEEFGEKFENIKEEEINIAPKEKFRRLTNKNNKNSTKNSNENSNNTKNIIKFFTLSKLKPQNLEHINSADQDSLLKLPDYVVSDLDDAARLIDELS